LGGTLGGKVNNELEKLWKETVTAPFDAMSWHLPGETGRSTEASV